MTKEFVFASHPEDDTLEMYCMGRLDEETIGWNRLVSAMRLALKAEFAKG